MKRILIFVLLVVLAAIAGIVVRSSSSAELRGLVSHNNASDVRDEIRQTYELSPGARVISTHYSPALVDVLKVLLCYSNNFMAERLGDQMGGAQGLAWRILDASHRLQTARMRDAGQAGDRPGTAPSRLEIGGLSCSH